MKLSAAYLVEKIRETANRAGGTIAESFESFTECPPIEISQGVLVVPDMRGKRKSESTVSENLWLVDFHVRVNRSDGSGEWKYTALIDANTGQVNDVRPYVSNRAAEGASSDRGALPGSVLQWARFIPQDRYEVIEQIRETGMSVVYKALEKSTGREVAVKITKSLPRTKQRRMFYNEQDILMRLTREGCPYIPAFIEAGDNWVAMEFVEGRNILDWANGVRDPVKVLEIVKKVLEALKYFHNRPRQIVNCDLKPHHIMVTADGNVKIIDFGLCREGRTEWALENDELAGTPIYMSEEQLLPNRVITTRTDLYQLSLIIGVIATGSLKNIGLDPENERVTDVVAYVLYTPKKKAHDIRPSLLDYWKAAPGIADIIAKGISRDTSEWYVNADQMETAIDDLIADSALSAADRRKYFSKSLPDPACPHPTWVGKAGALYNIFVRRLKGAPKETAHEGDFTALKAHFEKIREMGFGMAMLMPVTDVATFDYKVSDSPYSPLSMYGIDPRYIDLGAMAQFPGRTIIDKFLRFHYEENPENKPADYDEITSRKCLRDYADAKTLRVLRDNADRYRDFLRIFSGRPGGYKQEEFLKMSNQAIRGTGIYQQVFPLVLFEQYFARKQLEDAIRYAHKLGLFVLLDIPGFESVIGTKSVSSPEMLMRDGNGNLINNGWHIEDPVNGQRWSMLACYDWSYLKSVNYEPLLDVFRYWAEEIGIDGFRGDAWHYSYANEAAGYWDRVSEYCRENDLLFIAETGGCDNPGDVNARSRALGNLEAAKFFIDHGQGPPSLRNLRGFLTHYNHDPSVIFSATHDSFPVPDEYRALFGPGQHDVNIANTIHTLYSMASPAWTVFQGDERAENWRVHEPGKECTWRDKGLDRTTGKYDIHEYLKRLNNIRHAYPWLADRGNILWYEVSYGKRQPAVSPDDAGVLAFGRRSPDGRKQLITIINISGHEREGVAQLGLAGSGID
ncbi:MAG: 4-alpha-glucanotransferase, partial [Candidatus Omnitrophota bacterium]